MEIPPNQSICFKFRQSVSLKCKFSFLHCLFMIWEWMNVCVCVCVCVWVCVCVCVVTDATNIANVRSQILNGCSVVLSNLIGTASLSLSLKGRTHILTYPAYYLLYKRKNKFYSLYWQGTNIIICFENKFIRFKTRFGLKKSLLYIYSFFCLNSSKNFLLSFE
jgi:hypothetical protein